MITTSLLLAGAFVGATIWPRVVTVERRVIEPAIKAARSAPEAEPLVGLVETACPAVVGIQDDGKPNVPPSDILPSHGRHRRVDASAPPVTPVGFLVSPEGYIVTSAGALSSQGALHILLNDGRTLLATRSGSDSLSGLALLKVDGSGFPFLQYADAGFSKVGATALALASPNGSGCVAQAGMISADFLAEGSGRRVYVRIRPALEGILAGAPVLGTDGRVIGIAGLDSSRTDSNELSRILPANAAALRTSILLRGQSTENRLGIAAADVDAALAARLKVDRQRGAVVLLVADHTPADKAGLKAGDIILAASDQPVSSESELARALDTPANEIPLDIMRGSERMRIIVHADQ